MSKTCSLNAFVLSDCGPSRGLAEYVELNSCNDDITSHLAKCHLSREDISERDLILARVGLLDLDEKQIETINVCPKHRHSLGKFWRPSKLCQYPEHVGKKTVVGGGHVINLKMMKEIKTLISHVVPIGSRK